ncbi:phosphatase PAP2 family protein [soil metagenome]
MIEQLKDWDQQFLLFLNSFHVSWLDPVMLLVTRTEFWIPLYAFLIFLIFKNYKKDGWLVLAGIVITVVLADQITSSIMKPYFQRLRPSHEPVLQGVLHIVDGYRGGLYGFASSHAANTTGVAFFMFLLFRDSYKWMGLIFIWAFIMSYTRIYLGVHYPGDVLVGALVGILSGYSGFRFYLWLKSKVKKKSPANQEI